MDYDTVKRARALAEEVIRQAGAAALERFDKIAELTDKDDYGDVVTEVDHLAEGIILPRIQAEFPSHAIHSEEAGSLGGESDWLWLIDPLDGTNNFAIGLPVFTTSITLMYRGEPALGVVYEPLTARMFVSAAGEGAACNGLPMRIRPAANLAKANIGWIQGHAVRNDPHAVRLRHHLDISFKRMMRLWAPSLQWCMLAKGDIDGIVLYNSEGDDLYSGILMVKEAGGVVVDFEGLPFTGMRAEPYLIACHPDNADALLRTVRAGLSPSGSEATA